MIGAWGDHSYHLSGEKRTFSKSYLNCYFIFIADPISTIQAFAERVIFLKLFNNDKDTGMFFISKVN
jgi:hypothetical protein